MDFMLYEEVNEGYKSAEKGSSQIFPIFDGLAAAWT
jgi:hypothetical protein